MAEYPATTPVPVQVFRVGEMSLATMPCEIFCEIGLDYRRRTALKPGFMVSLNHGYFGYLPTPRQHDLGGYETWLGTNRLERTASEKLLAELRDRFGPAPIESMRLLELKRLQILSQTWQVDDIHVEGEFAVLGYRNNKLIKRLAESADNRLRIVDHKSAYYVLKSAVTSPEDLLEELKSLLQPDYLAAYNPAPSATR